MHEEGFPHSSHPSPSPLPAPPLPLPLHCTPVALSVVARTIYLRSAHGTLFWGNRQQHWKYELDFNCGFRA